MALVACAGNEAATILSHAAGLFGRQVHQPLPQLTLVVVHEKWVADQVFNLAVVPIGEDDVDWDWNDQQGLLGLGALDLVAVLQELSIV